MNELQTFHHYNFGDLRTVVKNGEPWFVAADVCRALELIDTGRAVERLDADEGTRIEIDHPQSHGKTMEVYAVSEPGLYSLVLGSRKPEAREFKRWITHEVIPSIRSHGMYATPKTVEAMLNDPDTMIRTLQALKEERAQRQALEAQAEADKPKVLFADSVATAHNSILVGDLAKLVRQNGVKIGQNRLFQWLRDNGFLMKQGESWNMPTQRSMELGLFEVKENTINNPDGSVRITRTTKVTGKGQIYFVNRLRSWVEREQ